MFQEVSARLDGTVLGVRDRGELDGAIARPFQTGAGGHVFFLSPFEKAAALADSIIRRQPFNDGNKRCAAFGAARLLSLFGILLLAEPDELRDEILLLDGGGISEDDFAGWLEAHCAPMADPEDPQSIE